MIAYKKHSKQYDTEGYCLVKKFLENSEIEYLRNALEKEFSIKKYPLSLYIHEFEDQELVKLLLKAITSSEIKNLIDTFMEENNLVLSILPFFHVQRNYQVNFDKSLGWHRDCGGELKYNYCNNILNKQSYFFSKIGIYLQDNNDFGGGVDLIPGTHTHIKKTNYFYRKLQGSRLNFVNKIFSIFPKIYKMINENFFMKFLKAKTMPTLKGDCIFFDSRIVHRGSLIDKKNIKSVNFTDTYHATTPKEKVKFSFYAHFGSPDAIDSYMYDRLKREGMEQEELKLWNEQINFIKKYSLDFSKKMEKIIFPINEKYKEYLVEHKNLD